MENLTNKKFGNWKVIKPDNNKNKYYICECDCGNIKSVNIYHLLDGSSKSCGCIQREKNSLRMKKLNTKHNLSKIKLYSVWHSILSRCYNKKNISYKHYGMKGVIVCDEWKNFINFYNWSIKNGYIENENTKTRNKITIDRINSNGNYEPNNCRWVNNYIQNNNKSNNKFYTYKNKTLTLYEWSRILGINRVTLYDRLKAGYSIEKAFTKIDYRKIKAGAIC